MNIEITGETERLLQRAMAIGQFATPQDCIAKVFAKQFPSDSLIELADLTSIEKLAEQQNAKPFRMMDRCPTDIWPEDNSIDEFLDFVRATRNESPEPGHRPSWNA